MYIKENNKSNLYMSTFIESYFNYTYEQAIILLWYIEEIGYIEHGISLRCPYIHNNGIKIVKNNSTN